VPNINLLYYKFYYVHKITAGKTMIAVRLNLCRAHIFGRTAKRRIFHGTRQKKRPVKNSLPCVFILAHGKK
jgi:hypothetical protein